MVHNRWFNCLVSLKLQVLINIKKYLDSVKNKWFLFLTESYLDDQIVLFLFVLFWSLLKFRNGIGIYINNIS